MNNSTLIYCLIIIVLIGMMAWYAVRLIRDRTNFNSGISEVRPYAAGGTLDLIIFFKSAIVPLLLLHAFTAQIVTIEEAPDFVATAKWSDFKFYFIFWQIMLQLANWWVCYGLAFRFTPGSVRNAKILFLITPLLPVALYFMTKSYLEESRAINMLVEFIVSFALSTLCFSYFTLSEQIREIYYAPKDENGRPVVNKDKPDVVVVSEKNQPGNGASIYTLNRTSSQKNNLKKCPYCSEEIKLEAIKCRFCLSELEPVTR